MHTPVRKERITPEVIGFMILRQQTPGIDNQWSLIC